MTKGRNIEITPEALFAEIRDLKETTIPDLKNEMTQTRNLIKQYNGLRQIVENVDKKVEDVTQKIECIDTKTNKVESKVKLIYAIPTILGGGVAFISFVYWLLTHLK